MFSLEGAWWRMLWYYSGLMLRQDFHYSLPPELIAQEPLPTRSASRMLCLDGASGVLRDRYIADVTELLRAGDLLVFNDTRVIPSRFFGVKATGGKVEVMLERILSTHRALVQIRASKTPKAGSLLRLNDCVEVEVIGRQDDLFEIEFHDPRPVLDILQAEAALPLPPYIERSVAAADAERYQTVFARHPGAVAAPTAGLHFDQPLLSQLANKGVEFAFVTLHVGAGTFQPLRTERIEDHRMHYEQVEVSAQVCEQVTATRSRGGRVVAVGTTAVRSLESASQQSDIAPYQGETNLFIYPGYRFKSVDALITNFHLPESTLLMLVCAFAGYTNVMAAYHHAIAQRYRFFSYGDAMFVLPNPAARQ